MVSVDKFGGNAVDMLQLRYGIYQEVQNDIGGDWSAGVLQGRESGSADGARGVGKFGGGAY